MIKPKSMHYVLLKFLWFIHEKPKCWKANEKNGQWKRYQRHIADVSI